MRVLRGLDRAFRGHHDHTGFSKALKRLPAPKQGGVFSAAALPAAVGAPGPGARAFSGFPDNTEFAKALKRLLALP